MAATQVARRRGTQSQAEAMTPVEGEIIVDLTNDTLRVGDGIRPGGWIMPNFNQLQTQAMQFAVATGTGNEIALSLNPAPLAYNQGLRVSFRAIANNTGAVTINVNGLGALSIQKVTENTISPLVTGDIVSGALYEIVHNGTGFQLLTSYQRGLLNVGQGDLRSSAGAVAMSITGNSTSARLLATLPGGEYGFYPMIRRLGAWSGNITVVRALTAIGDGGSTGYPSDFACRISCDFTRTIGGSGSASSTVQAYQRYVTSSPPYDLGNGEVGGFIFLLLNEKDDVVTSYVADTPPWAYNGPTDIRATHKCPISGKKYRTTCRKLSVKDIINGKPLEYIQEEITHELKNADMDLIPHPFGEVPEGHRVIMLDPMSADTERLVSLVGNGCQDEVNEILTGGYLKLDNSNIKRGCHKSVKACKFRFKNHG